jgi:hypothetical protein
MPASATAITRLPSALAGRADSLKASRVGGEKSKRGTFRPLAPIPTSPHPNPLTRQNDPDPNPSAQGGGER